MKRIVLSFSLCFLMFVLGQKVFADIKNETSTVYAGMDMEGRQRWEAETVIRQKEPGTYILSEKGKGVYSSFKGPVSWEAELEFKETKSSIVPLNLIKHVFDEKGNKIRLEKQDYDIAKRSVVCLHEEYPGKISRKKVFKLKKDAVNKLLLSLYVQKMLENGKKFREVQMVSEEPGLYNIDLKVVAEEEIVINNKKKRAYKVEIDPRLGALDIVKVFFPKAYAWHSSESPFEWLGFEGLEGDIRSEKIKVTIK